MNDYTFSNDTFGPRHDEHTDGSQRRRNPDQEQRRPGKEPRRRQRKDDDDMPRLLRKPIAFFRKRRTRVVLGIALILLACYLTIAALSFLKSGSADQSLMEQNVEQLAANPDAIENIAGPTGAKISHHLFVEGLGLGSIVLIVYIVILALALLGVKKVKFWSLTFKSLILAITISIVIGLFTIKSSATIPPGGYHGKYINEMLISHIGWIGAFIVSCLLMAIVAAIFIAQLTAIYHKSREKIRFLQAKKAYDDDRKSFEKRKVDEALSDGPMTSPDEVEPIVEQEDPEPDQPTPVTSAFDITRSNFSDIENAPKPPVDASAKTKDENDPTFEVELAQEIEQGEVNHDPLHAQGPYDPRADLSHYHMPPLELLHDRPRKMNSVDLAEEDENKDKITKTLKDYGIEIQSIKAIVGPTVTLYKIVPSEGVRIAKIKRLEDDIAMSLAAKGIRIIAPIPGESNIGIEVPNKDPQTVSIRSILGSKAFQECKSPLPMALGTTISNQVYIAELTKMPHLLVAGATGQGKSVGLNTIIASLLYKRHPAELKFVLIDPKQVEFSLYSRIENHYLAKLPEDEEAVVTNPVKVVDTLNSLCVEMENRYTLLKEASCRSIIEYNDKFVNRRLNPERGHRFMPYIVVIVDEFADLMMISGKSVEMPIARIAQKARAVGIHLIIATQRPSTNVITGLIKANFPGRIAFAVRQRVDSQIILDCTGANQLIGKGDMLISSGGGSMDRVQCAFIDTDEVEDLCKYIDDQQGYPTAYILPDPPTDAAEAGPTSGSLSERDSLFDEVARIVVQGSTASTSNIQRRYSIGYNRAGKIMDQLEAAGIVGPSTGGKPRQVLVDPTQLEMILGSL